MSRVKGGGASSACCTRARSPLKVSRSGSVLPGQSTSPGRGVGVRGCWARGQYSVKNGSTCAAAVPATALTIEREHRQTVHLSLFQQLEAALKVVYFS